MKTVLLSGAGGFIAQHAARKFKEAGFRTLGISRRARPLPSFDAVFKGALTETLTDVFEEEIDAFIHCAYHVGKLDDRINVEGTRLWAEQAEKKGVKQQLFLGSVSARIDSSSSYARSKHELEEWFTSRHQVVFRLGLVVGKGGLFQRMTDLVRSYPVLPLLDGGRRRVYVLGIDDLCEALKFAVVKGTLLSGQSWNLFQSTPVLLRDLLEETKRQLQVSCFFVPVPSGTALFFIRLLENIPLLNLKISSNNIIGLRQNLSREGKSDYARFGLYEVPLKELVKRAL